MKKRQKILFVVLIVLVLGGALLYGTWPHLINGMMPPGSRPGAIEFAHETLTLEELDQLGLELRKAYPGEELEHIDRFRRAGITSYEGPQTCLQCHANSQVVDAVTGEAKQVDLMENLLGSAHYRFFTTEHPNVWGFNGELADDFPMGKIDRPCPKPGSFAMTAWAELVVTEHGDTLSEGCGQCHIGGQYQAPLGEIMPGYRTLEEEKQAIDCLICHAAAYDMNAKQVVVDDNGYARWDQDRSMRAALSTVNPTSETCLRCHQHNFGGDIYIEEGAEEYMQSMVQKGHERPRIAHPGSKRGTPFSPDWDVHARAGMDCIDCHTTEGHLIAKGTHTTTMMANDLPQTEVSCDNCHSARPHVANEELSGFLNDHTDVVACVTCHIPSLQQDNATRRDFDTPMWEEHPGIHVYTDTEKATTPRDGGITFKWWNGDATFLGNPIGDNPNGEDRYRFYEPTHTWPEFADYDYASWYEEVMRPIAKKKPSKLYAMKVFNGRQHIDLANIGPFGGMYVPYNLPDYYVHGDPVQAGRKELEKPMMGMMYGFMFKTYLMDQFMAYMDVEGWDTAAREELLKGENMEARWIPVDASMEISHGIRLEGAHSCDDCHSADSIIPWEELGYSEQDADFYRMSML